MVYNGANHIKVIKSQFSPWNNSRYGIHTKTKLPFIERNVLKENFDEKRTKFVKKNTYSRANKKFMSQKLNEK